MCKLSTASCNFLTSEAGGCGNSSVVRLMRKVRLAGITSNAAISVCEGDNDVIDGGGGNNNSAVQTLRKARLAGIT